MQPDPGVLGMLLDIGFISGTPGRTTHVITRLQVDAGLVALAVASRGACAPDGAPAPEDTTHFEASAPEGTAFASFARDSIVDGYGEPDLAHLDSLRGEMARLEQALARAPQDGHPQLLLELGRVKRLYLPSPTRPAGSSRSSRERANARGSSSATCSTTGGWCATSSPPFQPHPTRRMRSTA